MYMEWRQWCCGTYLRLEVLISPGWNYFANGNFMLLWFSNSLWLMLNVSAVASISPVIFYPSPKSHPSLWFCFIYTWMAASRLVLLPSLFLSLYHMLCTINGQQSLSQPSTWMGSRLEVHICEVLSKNADCWDEQSPVEHICAFCSPTSNNAEMNLCAVNVK